jgi:hypothetical protein
LEFLAYPNFNLGKIDNFSRVFGIFGPEKTQNGFSKKRVFDPFSGHLGEIHDFFALFAQRSLKKDPFLRTLNFQMEKSSVQNGSFSDPSKFEI